MDGVKFEEVVDEKVVYCTTPKRKNRLKIFVPIGNFPFWKVTYEDGRAVDGLEGSFTSRLDAMKCVADWETRVLPTDEAKQLEMFGDKQPPVLKRKKIRDTKPRSKTG